MGILNKQLALFTIIICILCSYNAKSQSLVFEKSYKLSSGSSFVNGFISYDNNLVMSCMKLDSVKNDVSEYLYSSVVKADLNGNILWDKVAKRFSGNYLIFENDKLEYVSIDDYYKIHIADYIGDYNLSATKFDKNGEFVSQNIDSISAQTPRLYLNGKTFKNTNQIFNATSFSMLKDSTLAIRLKYFDMDANFIKEDSLGFVKIADTMNIAEISNVLVLSDSQFLISVKVSGGMSGRYQNFFVLKFDYNTPAKKFALSALYRHNTTNNLGNTQKFSNMFMNYNYQTYINKLQYKGSYLTNSFLYLDPSNGIKKEIIFDKYHDIVFTDIVPFSYKNRLLACGFKREILTDAQYWSYFVMEFDDNFNLIYEYFWDRDKVDKGLNKIILDESRSSYFVIGSSQYNTQAYIAKFNEVTDVIENTSIDEICISPNPASDYIEINVRAGSKPALMIDFEIFNIFGEKIPPRHFALQNATPQEGNFKIDISNLPAGVYFVKVGDKFKKFMKW
jgi:hypothetical protein